MDEKAETRLQEPAEEAAPEAIDKVESATPRFESRAFDVELRVEQRHRGAPPTIVGHAAVFNSLSEDLGGFREQIAPGAFARTLREGGPVYALWNHDPNYVIASTKNGTLRLSEDRAGLRAEMDPIDTPTIRDLVVKPIQDGYISKMSFGFSVPRGGDEMTYDRTMGPVRTLRDVDLFDVSPVTFPAYPATDISARMAAIRRLSTRATDPSVTDLMQQMCDLMDALMEKMGMSDGDADEMARNLERLQEKTVEDVQAAGAVRDAARLRELILNMKRTA